MVEKGYTMLKNYACESGAYRALAGMMRDKIRDLDSKDQFDREWAVRCLKLLAEQFEETVAEFDNLGVDSLKG
jgi:hypothetical protein